VSDAGGAIEQDSVEVDGVRTFLQGRRGEGIPTLFVHGNPTDGDDWLPFMDELGGPAIAPDLPGWGRSARPDYETFDGSMSGLASYLERLLDALGVGEYKLVCHDWGAVGLIAAQAHPQRLRRLVAINTVPLTGAYRWHGIARLWRRRGLGELVNRIGRTRPGKAVLRQLIGRATPLPGLLPPEYADRVLGHLDPGNSDAILRLYRSADPEALAAAGSRLAELSCPALVLWGGADPYIPARFGPGLAGALPDANLVELGDGGHWPWIERPEVVPMVARFLGES
jgi:pimeloyl-ACP methyl ester carboxylesterase